MDTTGHSLINLIRSYQNDNQNSKELVDYLHNDGNNDIVVKIASHQILKNHYSDFQTLFNFLYNCPRLNPLLVRIVNNLLIGTDLESKNTETMNFILELVYLRRDLFHPYYYEIIICELARFGCFHGRKLSKSPSGLGFLFTCFNQVITLALETPNELENIEWFENSLELGLHILHTRVRRNELQEPMFLFFEYTLAFINHIDNTRLHNLLIKFLDDLLRIASHGNFFRCIPIITGYFNSLDMKLVDKNLRKNIFKFFKSNVLKFDINTPNFYNLIESVERFLLETRCMDTNSCQFNSYFCNDSVQKLTLQIQNSSQTIHECAKRLIVLIYKNTFINLNVKDQNPDKSLKE